MTVGKQRVTVTMDPELVDAGNRAVASGETSSLSAWVNAALADRARRGSLSFCDPEGNAVQLWEPA